VGAAALALSGGPARRPAGVV